MDPMPPPPPLGEEPFADVAEAAAPVELTASGEIIAQVRRRAARVERTALAVILLAVLIAAGAYTAARHLVPPPTPEAIVAAHVSAADRLLAAGRLGGKGGALEHLLEARRIAPSDAAAAARLAHVADLLEGLGTRALERGDLAVAAIHLADAQRAAPDRPSIRAKLERLSRRSAGAARREPSR